MTKVLHSLMHIVKLLQTWLINTEGKLGVMICLGQGSLRSPSALFSLIYVTTTSNWGNEICIIFPVDLIYSKQKGLSIYLNQYPVRPCLTISFYQFRIDESTIKVCNLHIVQFSYDWVSELPLKIQNEFSLQTQKTDTMLDQNSLFSLRWKPYLVN